MRRDLELRTRKLLQDQRRAGKITKKKYDEEINFIKKLKQDKDERIKTNARKVPIQMAQGWCSTATTYTSYKLGKYTIK